uniref:Uncharacterized protein n=1 Tax=Peronospora matthiolae TaxID=2874970 RepID=A0AAV1U3T2_9STRA
MTLDDATNKAVKQILNRLNDARHRLRASVGVDIEDDFDVLGEVAMDADASRKEESMWTLSTDLPRVMKSLRRKKLFMACLRSCSAVRRMADTT